MAAVQTSVLLLLLQLLYHAGLLLTSYKFLMPYSPAAVLRRRTDSQAMQRQFSQNCSRCPTSNRLVHACPLYTGAISAYIYGVLLDDTIDISSHPAPSLLLHCYQRTVSLTSSALSNLLVFTCFHTRPIVNLYSP